MMPAVRALLIASVVVLAACGSVPSTTDAGGSGGGGAVGGGNGGDADAGAGGTGGGAAGSDAGGGVGGGAAGAGGGGGGSAGGGSAGGTGGSADTDGGCLRYDAGIPLFTGTTRMVTTDGGLNAALTAAMPGDRIVVQAGSYGSETLTRALTQDVLVEPAPGATVVFHGLQLRGAAHLVFRDLKFDNTVKLNNAHDVVFDHVDLDVGALDVSGLELFNSQGATHHVRVLRSRIAHGARTIFIGGSFGLEATWNHDLEFRGNEFICGTHNCFQFSGGRDSVIEDNDFHDPAGGGVLTAGATRIVIARNRMRGTRSLNKAAIQLATPGTEWDNYAGVQYMITSHITVANNLIVSWGTGIELDAATELDIVYNTIADVGQGLHTWRRSPHDQQGNVIRTGNDAVRFWNNIAPSISLDSGDPRPAFESNNLVRTGGGGTSLITTAPTFADTVNYAPAAASPQLDRAVVTSTTPLVDRRGSPRTATADIGAWELEAASCP